MSDGPNWSASASTRTRKGPRAGTYAENCYIHVLFSAPKHDTQTRPVKMGSKFRLVVYFRFGGKGGVGFEMEEVIKITGARNSWMPFENWAEPRYSPMQVNREEWTHFVPNWMVYFPKGESR